MVWISSSRFHRWADLEREGTREFVKFPYVIVYRIKDEAIELLHIHHGAQDWE